jgi:glycosyltransferase involved in cell wall biosynthesis
MKQGFLIPVYNHGKTVGPIVERLAEKKLPIILVDDGSDGETKGCLDKTAAAFACVLLVTLEKNLGKGGAVSAGIDTARGQGLTHVLQIDADGQHDVERAGYFLEQSRLYPAAVICSYPEYDAAAPASRKNGRVVANTWAKIVTVSSQITDAMCGFRVYPVEPVWNLVRRHHIDCRMGFDIEILVRLYWKNIPLIFYPIRVGYPENGISHFHVVYDNARISWVFTRLFFGMLWRLPALIYRACTRRRQGVRQ